LALVDASAARGQPTDSARIVKQLKQRLFEQHNGPKHIDAALQRFNFDICLGKLTGIKYTNPLQRRWKSHKAVRFPRPEESSIPKNVAAQG
jgi:hypothetical protein